MVGARPATISDAAAVAHLRRVALAEALEKRGGDQFGAAELAEPEVPVDAVAGSDAPDAAVVVGLIGEDAIGVASFTRVGHRVRLVELFTHPDARGVGVGHAMLGEVKRIARAWNCTDLDSFALPGDRDTKNFFESHAMKSRLLVVHTPL